MKTLPALLLSALCAMPASACDKADAARVQLAFAEMGAWWSEQGGRVVVEWGRAWDGAGPQRRVQLLRTFAQADACLAGAARTIAFHRHARQVGTASAAGVELAPAVSRVGAAAPAPACQ